MPRHILDANGFAVPFVTHSPLAVVDIGNAWIESGPFVLPPRLARLRLKEWQHFCLISDTALVTLAVVDAKYARLGWTQVVDLASGERWEHHRRSPFASMAIARSLWDERTFYHAPGFAVDIHSHLAGGEYGIEVAMDAHGDTPTFTGSWRAAHDPDTTESLVVSLPLGRRRCAYSHKVPIPVTGTLAVGDRTFEFPEGRSVAIIDVHKAHYPRDMFWRWATFAGYDDAGRLVGMNLTKNVVEDDFVWNENAVWVNGKVHGLGPALFEFDRDTPGGPWRLGTADDAVHVTFEPAGSRGESVDVPGLMRSRFTQHYGRFRGAVRAGAEVLRIDGLWGLCEDHESVW